MLSRRTLLLTAVGLATAGYLGMLQVRASDRDPPLAVLYTSGITEQTVRNPRTGLAGWAVRADVEALIRRVTDARGWRTTEQLRADGTDVSSRVVEVRGHRLGLVEAPASALEQLPALVAGLQGVELTLIATTAAPKDVLERVDGPIVVLPGAWGAGAPDGGEVSGNGRMVAPWVDGRRAVGQVTVRFDPLRIQGTAIEIPLREAPDAPTVIGQGRPALDHDTVRFERSGLGDALLARILDVTGADIAIINFLALRTGLVGPVDLLTLEKALPFHNEVVLVTCTTAQLTRILEQGSKDDTSHLLVASRAPLPAPLPEQHWRLAAVDYLTNGGRGKWPTFLEGQDRLRTRITLDDLAIRLLDPP